MKERKDDQHQQIHFRPTGDSNPGRGLLSYRSILLLRNNQIVHLLLIA